jgi:hypothetical protein
MIIKVWCDLLIQDFYTVLELLKVGCFTHLITIKKYTFWKESLNSDGQQFHQYERKKPITPMVCDTPPYGHAPTYQI